jgi:hypothetical protein
VQPNIMAEYQMEYLSLDDSTECLISEQHTEPFIKFCSSKNINAYCKQGSVISMTPVGAFDSLVLQCTSSVACEAWQAYHPMGVCKVLPAKTVVDPQPPT